jgi:hypothetical protein
MKVWNGMRIRRAKVLSIAKVIYTADPASKHYARVVDYSRLSPIIKNRYERIARAALQASVAYDRKHGWPIPVRDDE